MTTTMMPMGGGRRRRDVDFVDEESFTKDKKESDADKITRLMMPLLVNYINIYRKVEFIIRS